jgi:hypothetical protein
VENFQAWIWRDDMGSGDNNAAMQVDPQRCWLRRVASRCVACVAAVSVSSARGVFVSSPRAQLTETAALTPPGAPARPSAHVSRLSASSLRVCWQSWRAHFEDANSMYRHLTIGQRVNLIARCAVYIIATLLRRCG